MKSSFLGAIVLALALNPSSGAQSPGGAHAGYSPTKAECLAKARQADDVMWLSHRPASEINELDWQLSVCEGKFIPLKPEGAVLISEAHGSVADEMRMRLEKAVSTLPLNQQKQVWYAFNSDLGDPAKK